MKPTEQPSPPSTVLQSVALFCVSLTPTFPRPPTHPGRQARVEAARSRERSRRSREEGAMVDWRTGDWGVVEDWSYSWLM